MKFCDFRILESSFKFSRFPCYNKALQENVPDETVFKKGSFSLLWFSLKQVLESEEHEHLSYHWLLVIIKHRHFMYFYFLKKLSYDVFINIKLLTSITEKK